MPKMAMRAMRAMRSSPTIKPCQHYKNCTMWLTTRIEGLLESTKTQLEKAKTNDERRMPNGRTTKYENENEDEEDVEMSNSRGIIVALARG